MPVFAIQPAYSRGEISPRLYSRADISHYALALKECTNFTVLRQGGLTRRTGTRFINEVKTSSQKVRLLDFVFSTEQAYILEFGNLYFRIYALGGRVESPPGTPVEVVTPYTEAQLFDLQFVQSADVLYIAHSDHAPQKVSRTSDTAWTIAPVDFKDGPWGDINPGTDLDETNLVLNPDFKTGIHDWLDTVTGTGYIRYDAGLTAALVSKQVATTGNATLKQAVVTTNANDVHVLHVEIVGSGFVDFRVGTTDGGVQLVAAQNLKPAWYSFVFTPNQSTFHIRFERLDMDQGNYEAGPGTVRCYTVTAKLLKPSATSGTVTVTAQGHAPFSSSDVGRQLRLSHMGRQAGWGVITAFTSSTQVTVSVKARFASTANTEQWQLGAFSAKTGYPARVGFYQERLVWARTKEKPQTIWFSKSGQLEEYGTSLPIEDTDALAFTILSESVNEIQWMKEGSDLLIGTKTGIRSLGPADNSNAFSPTNVLQKRHVNYGAAAVQPTEIGQATLYVDRFKTGVREAMYSFENDTVVAPEVTILSEHVFAAGVVDAAYTAHPMSVLWLAMGNGKLVGITYERDQEMFATHVHPIGGTLGTHGFVESVASIPGATGDELWMIVKRTIGGVTKRYVELLSDQFNAADPASAFFVDSGLTYNGVPTNSFSGLAHLNGEQVAILGDGAVFPPQTVAGGSVSLPGGATVSKASIGLAYNSQVHTLDPGVSRGDGSGLGRRKKITKVMIDLFETGNLDCKTASGNKAEIVLFRSTGDTMDQPVPLKSGFFTVRPDGSWGDFPGEIVLSIDDPLPATIRSTTLVLEPEP